MGIVCWHLGRSIVPVALKHLVLIIKQEKETDSDDYINDVPDSSAQCNLNKRLKEKCQNAKCPGKDLFLGDIALISHDTEANHCHQPDQVKIPDRHRGEAKQKHCCKNQVCISHRLSLITFTMSDSLRQNYK